jgi:hypothetical protein
MKLKYPLLIQINSTASHQNFILLAAATELTVLSLQMRTGNFLRKIEHHFGYAFFIHKMGIPISRFSKAPFTDHRYLKSDLCAFDDTDGRVI